MDAFKLEAFKVALFILPGIITLRIKAALSISAPSKPLNTVIDGLAFTLVDHALFGLVKAMLDALSRYPIFRGIKSAGAAVNASQVQLDGSLLPIVGEGVLLTRENPIVRVELWNPRPSDSVASAGGANV